MGAERLAGARQAASDKYPNLVPERSGIQPRCLSKRTCCGRWQRPTTRAPAIASTVGSPRISGCTSRVRRPWRRVTRVPAKCGRDLEPSRQLCGFRIASIRSCSSARTSLAQSVTTAKPRTLSPAGERQFFNNLAEARSNGDGKSAAGAWCGRFCGQSYKKSPAACCSLLEGCASIRPSRTLEYATRVTGLTTITTA